MLNESDPDNNSHIIKLQNTFIHENHFCLVLDLCHTSLLSEIKKNFPRCMEVNDIKKVAVQLITALLFLDKYNIIHAGR